MKLNKRQTYFAVLITGIFLCLLYQSVWIFSSTARAEILGTYIYKDRKRDISWMKASYEVNYEKHYGYYLKDGFDADERFFEIRYLLFAPGLSRTNNFTSNWGPLIMFYILYLLIATIVFIRKDIIADQAEFQLYSRFPYLKLVNNEIEDYDQHDIIKEKESDEDKALIKSIETEKNSSLDEAVRVSLYQYNPNAVIILIVYIFYFFWFFLSLLSQSFGTASTIVLGIILIFVPLYVQNTNNPKFKMKIPEKGALVFSSLGVDCKKYFCPITDIESAVVYLEAFNGFIFRDRTTTGNSKTRSYGDNNKISFRNNGEVTDFTFILESAKDYWAFKNLMSVWSGKGVNVYLQKVFDDDFIVQEMVHFHILNG